MIDLKIKWLGLPWWCSGWESACQCRGHGFEPWSGKIPHAAEQLGPWTTITEPARLEPVLRNKRGHDSERPAHRDEEWPPLAATGESRRTETKTQHRQKKKKKIWVMVLKVIKLIHTLHLSLFPHKEIDKMWVFEIIVFPDKVLQKFFSHICNNFLSEEDQ